MISEYVKTAMESRAREIEAAVVRFRDCGVEMERFSLLEYSDPPQTVLCVDGIPRFSWRLEVNLPGHPWRRDAARLCP